MKNAIKMFGAWWAVQLCAAAASIALTGCGDDGTIRFVEVNDAGEPVEEPVGVVEIGTTDQAIYLPTPYGAEKGTENGVKGPICNPPWSGGECQAPSNKTLDIKFYASTCNATWQGYVVKGWNEFVNHISGLTTTGFTVTTSANPKYEVRCMATTAQNACGPSTGSPLGYFFPDLSASAHDTQLGDLRHWTGGDITICPDNFAAHAVWAGTTATKKERAAANTIKHEMFHAAGWCHYQSTQNHLMKAGADMGTSSSSWFTVNYSVPVSMTDAMRCYDPTSDTEPNCPN